MKNVPNWQLLMLIYFFTVAIPVYIIHSKLKQRALINRTFTNFLIYVVAVLGTAFIMHYLTMWLYFTFFFTVKD